MTKISIVINADTRPLNTSADQMFSGTVSRDYLTEGVKNKIKFFEGYEKEVILYIDQHEPLSDELLAEIRPLCDKLMTRLHTNEPSFNCWNYHRALSLATGDIICHFDQDTAAFTTGKEYVDELIENLNRYQLVSYPSHWSPNPVHDDSFGGKYWCSTRFFLCRKEALKLPELAECIKDPEWMYLKYGDSPRRCNWLEHYLAKINYNAVYYPPVELHKGAIFNWKTYQDGTLNILNNADYETIKQWILHKGGIGYPNDVSV